MKCEKNLTASGGRRYSPDYVEYVNFTKKSLADIKLCKKSTVRLLRCSLNFLYARDNESKKNAVIPNIHEIREMVSTSSIYLTLTCEIGHRLPSTLFMTGLRTIFTDIEMRTGDRIRTQSLPQPHSHVRVKTNFE